MKSQPRCQALILKVASRCNLNCSYCYMYNLGDVTYQAQPVAMSGPVVEATLTKVRNHCIKHRLKHFDFIFHGGEPLLLKKHFYETFVERAKAVLLPEVTPSFALQTNGILITPQWCQLFNRLGIRLGISLDGTPEVNDKFRVDHRGQGSYEKTVRGLKIAQQASKNPEEPGVLCVIDVHADPLAVYNHLRSLSVRNIGFLLPYATHDQLPPGLSREEPNTSYADWLIAIFDQWWLDKPRPRIRILEQVLELIMGIDRGFEYLGARKNEFLVIETDGSIEAAGALKVCGNGFTKAGMNILVNELDEALQTDLIELYHSSHSRLAKKCKKCPVVKICGGGFLPHRFSRKRGFDNTSVFCLDLMKLIVHIQNKVLETLPRALVVQSGLSPLDYAQLRRYAAAEV